MRKLDKILHLVALFVVLSFSIPSTVGDLLAQEKNKGDISVTLGTASNDKNLPSSLGMIKTLSWRPFRKWISVGANIGILQNEVPIIAHLTLSIPLKWIEPYVTAGWGFIVQNLSSANNYGGGVKIRITKAAALLLEYRKMTISKTSGLYSRYSMELDYIGAGITYYF